MDCCNQIGLGANIFQKQKSAISVYKILVKSSMIFKQIQTQILDKNSKKQEDVPSRIQKDTNLDGNSQQLILPISYISAKTISMPSFEKQTVIPCKNHEAGLETQKENNQQIKSNKDQYQKCKQNFQIVQNMLTLEAKWICKQKQIKQYVQLLERTIDEKDTYIEQVQSQINKIWGKFGQVLNQKNIIINKLTQIHQNLKLLQKNRPVQDIHQNTQTKGLFSRQNLQLSTQIQQKYQGNGSKSKPEKQSRTKSGQNLDNSNLQARILVNIMKLIEENILNYNKSDSQSCYQEIAAKTNINEVKQRQIRATTSTDDTFLQQNKRNFTKVKRQNKQTSNFYNQACSFDRKTQNLNNQNISPANNLKKTENYKSAKTITFSRQEQYQSHLNIAKYIKAKYFSQNRIQSSENQIEFSEQKIKENETKLEFPHKEKNEEQTRKIRGKKHTLNSQIVHLFQNGSIGRYLKNNQQNYSLSSSFISDSSFNASNQDYQKTFCEEIFQNKSQSDQLEQLIQAQGTMKHVLDNIYQQGRYLKNYMPHKSEQKKQAKRRSQNIKQNLQNTHTKKSQFFLVEQGNQKTEVKRRNFQIFDQMNCNIERQRPLGRQASPETKCTSFQESSLSNNFYNQKSVSCSQNPFRSLNMSSELSAKLQPLAPRINSDKTAFENEMLKCYNGVLDRKVKPLSKTQKLRGRFQTQNNCLLSKLNSKKSIS